MIARNNALKMACLLEGIEELVCNYVKEICRYTIISILDKGACMSDWGWEYAGKQALIGLLWA